MQRFYPVGSSDGGLEYLPAIGIHLDLDIRVHRKLSDPLFGTDIDPLNVLPSSRFKSFDFFYIVEHRFKGNRWDVARSFHFCGLNPVPLFLYLQQQATGCDDQNRDGKKWSEPIMSSSIGKIEFHGAFYRLIDGVESAVGKVFERNGLELK